MIIYIHLLYIFNQITCRPVIKSYMLVFLCIACYIVCSITISGHAKNIQLYLHILIRDHIIKYYIIGTLPNLFMDDLFMYLIIVAHVLACAYIKFTYPWLLLSVSIFLFLASGPVTGFCTSSSTSICSLGPVAGICASPSPSICSFSYSSINSLLTFSADSQVISSLLLSSHKTCKYYCYN